MKVKSIAITLPFLVLFLANIIPTPVLAIPIFSIDGDAVVAEGGIASYFVSISEPLSVGDSASVEIDTGGGINFLISDANEGFDFFGVHQTLVFLGGGNTSQLIQVQTIFDTLNFEGDEDFSIGLSNPSLGLIDSAKALVNTVIDEDGLFATPVAEPATLALFGLGLLGLGVVRQRRKLA